MKETVLIISIFGIFACGYFWMGKLDKFIEENRKVSGNEYEKKPASCVMLTDELSDEEITNEIRIFREKHSDTKILLCAFSSTELSEGCDYYVKSKN